MPKAVTRKPSHAGSWYEDEAPVLGQQIDQWMAEVAPEPGLHARAIIAPHAGYRYCGHVMAYAYKHIDPNKVSRVFLLGPSHHVYTAKCALSPAATYTTPIGTMTVDQGIYAELKATGKFEMMALDVDEAEHSLELHTPYIVRTMGSKQFTLVPIMIGALNNESEAEYGRLLAPYMDDPSNLFVISSDFCHWGSRFRYSFYEESKGPIWKSIQWLDELGIAAITTGRAKPFAEYLAQYRNTICGRHPIGVLLNMLEASKLRHKVRFTRYDQSSKCVGPGDSSVSYASAIVNIVD